MAADALGAYLADRAADKDALLVCDTRRWPTRSTARRTTPSPPTGRPHQAARDHRIAVGDLIISRHNDASNPRCATPTPGADREPEQVRNGQPLARHRHRREDQPASPPNGSRQGPRRLLKATMCVSTST